MDDATQCRIAHHVFKESALSAKLPSRTVMFLVTAPTCPIVKTVQTLLHVPHAGAIRDTARKRSF
jgi:hypothetical protein